MPTPGYSGSGPCVRAYVTQDFPVLEHGKVTMESAERHRNSAILMKRVHFVQS